MVRADGKSFRARAFNLQGAGAQSPECRLAWIEAGSARLPERVHWLQDFETEVLRFPCGRHDDQVDSMSQFLNWHREKMRNELPPLLVADLSRPSYWSVDERI